MEISSERIKINALLRRHGISAGTIAAQLKVNRSAVYQSMNGLGSRRIRVTIATLLGIKPSALWHDNVRRAIIDDLDFEAQNKGG